MATMAARLTLGTLGRFRGFRRPGIRCGLGLAGSGGIKPGWRSMEKRTVKSVKSG